MHQQKNVGVDVQTFIDTRKFSGYQWLIFVLCFLVVLLDGFDTAAIGYIAPSLLNEWGIDKPALAPVLSAALFGLACGALLAGPLADRQGRKRVLLGSVILLGVVCLLSAFSNSLRELIALRFISGVGLGAAMPNAVTLFSEYCPSTRRALLTSAMFCGFPLGASVGGFQAAWMIPHWGWRSVLMFGGIAPLLLGALMLCVLPESVRYMVANAYPAERIRKTLQRICVSAREITTFHSSEHASMQVSADRGRGGLALVLSTEYRLGSFMLWLTYFMGLVIAYALINWMPVLLKAEGVSAQRATLIAALFPLGGIGAVFCGWLMDRFNANKIVAVGYALTSLSVYLIGQAVGREGWLVMIVFIAGTIMNTTQSSMPALAAAFYPTAGRATGVAWMPGVGRFGGIAGSFLVGELTAQKLAFGSIFTIVATAGLVAAVALLIKQRAHPIHHERLMAPSPGHL